MNLLALAPIIILSILLFGMTYFVVKIMNWQKLPTIDQYLEQHPNNKTESGVKCNACRADAIEETGLWGNESRERVFVCTSCNAKVYRSEN